MRAIVKKSRKTDYPTPLRLNIGDAVTVIEFCSTPGWKKWVKCRHDDNIGWIPKEILTFTNTYSARVEAPYNATELDVTKGDIFIYSKTFSGWAWGNLEGTSDTGWVPLEILEEI
jgi:hypothetical protein